VNSTATKRSRGPSWFFILLGIPVLTYWLSGPYVSSWVNSWETAPSGYAILATNFPALPTQLQHDIAAHVEKGYLTNQDVSGLIQRIVTAKGSVQTYPAPDIGDGQVSALGPIDQAMGKRQDSHAKRKLLALTESFRE
jgi:hypothetical protein